MADPKIETGFAPINNARIYYEIAGQGQPFVMIHAGVADSRQWNNEFAHFAGTYRALRYDMRGYGKSEPVEGDYRHIDDLAALLDHLGVNEPLVLMGCSMGGGIAMDFVLEHPERTKALIMVGSAPSGLKLETPTPALFEQVEKAWTAGDYDRVAELETQIWFDGAGRKPDQVNQPMRKLLFEMNHQALLHEAKNLGKRVPDADMPAADRLGKLKLPILVVTGVHDTPYLVAASDYMVEHIPSVQRMMMADAAHLPNMDHPEEFRGIVTRFLDTLS